MRDAVANVPIDVLVTGDVPGDGKPKPVAFPDPQEASEHDASDGYPVLELERLIELELAGGMSAPHRLRDLADVIDLVRKRSLPQEIRAQLDPWVQAKVDARWDAAQVDDDR